MRKEAWCKKGRPEAPIINPPPFFRNRCLSISSFLPPFAPSGKRLWRRLSRLAWPPVVFNGVTASLEFFPPFRCPNHEESLLLRSRGAIDEWASDLKGISSYLLKSLKSLQRIYGLKLTTENIQLAKRQFRNIFCGRCADKSTGMNTFS